MPHEIFYRESHGEDGREIVFVKSNDERVIRKVESPTRTASKYHGTIFVTFLKEVFLPQGFPNSVHADYIPYQIWDTVQAFASTVMGTLTTHSIMRGVGVGESNATALAAAITWILKDGTGMLGRIVFAWWNGPGLDAQCKKWRLFADILNDFAMGIELMLPLCLNYSTIILCISTAMKSVVGVAGGATRAAITQHQALENNLADVSAKDGSQETMVNLIGSFLGILILSNLGDGRYIMELFILLVMVHLYANYRAVKALRLNSLNEDRLAFIVRNYLISRTIPSTSEVNNEESVLLYKDSSREIFGFRIKMGISMESLFKNDLIKAKDVELLSNLFQNRRYLIIMDIKRKTIFIPLAKNITTSDVLQAYFHACIYALITCMSIRMPLDILLNAKSHNPSNLLTRMHLVTKKYPSLHDIKIASRISVETCLATNQLVVTEYKIFVELLEKSEWLLRMNLFPVGQWRGTWGNIVITKRQ